MIHRYYYHYCSLLLLFIVYIHYHLYIVIIIVIIIIIIHRYGAFRAARASARGAGLRCSAAPSATSTQTSLGGMI